MSVTKLGGPPDGVSPLSPASHHGPIKRELGVDHGCGGLIGLLGAIF